MQSGCASIVGRLAQLPATALLLVAASLLGPSVGSVDADHEPQHESVARLEVEVQSFYTVNDQDLFGSGDLYLIAYLVPCYRSDQEEGPCEYSETYAARHLSGGIHKFNADSGETVVLNQVFPRSGDWVGGHEVSEPIGLPVYPDRRYRLVFLVEEQDSNAAVAVRCLLLFQALVSESCETEPYYIENGLVQGTSFLDLEEDTNWGIGGHLATSSKQCSRLVSLLPPTTEVGPCFEFSYQVRRASLPDLHPTGLRVDNPPGAKQPNLCATVENKGQQNSGPFRIAFSVDRVLAGDAPMSGVAVGQSIEQCAQVNPLVPGRRAISVMVDAPRDVPEMDESNNVLSQAYIPGMPDGPLGQLDDPAKDPGTGLAQPGSAPANEAASGVNLGERGDDRVVTGPGQTVDLLVSGIRLQGSRSDGANDCDPGQNTISVTVKNQGAGPAAGFAVRLVIDEGDTEAKEKSGLTLDGGKQLDVAFEDVRLAKGKHELSALADAKKVIPESNEGNNELRTSAQCRDD